MKDECYLSYVCWKSRPNSIDTTKVILSRNLFAIDFLQEIDEHTLVINIDESVVSRNTKINYAWSMRGQPKEYKNFSFQGSISVIMAILSNEWWMTMLIKTSVDSEIFWYFIDHLQNWIEKNEQFGFQKCWLHLTTDLAIKVKWLNKSKNFKV